MNNYKPKTVTVTILWCAFGDKPERNRWMQSATITLPIDEKATDLDVCNVAYTNTNLYSGALWDILEPALPEDRTHTALSIGDLVIVDGRRYRCAEVGWEAA
jgi:hypothetical protein